MIVDHGIVTSGKDVRDAVIRAVLLENACHQQVLTYSLGGNTVHWSDDTEALAKRRSVWAEHHLAMLWDYLERGLAHENNPS